MSWTTTHTTQVFSNDEDGPTEIELKVTLAPAEPDVGIMGAYVDDWEVTEVAGDTEAQLCRDTEARIQEEIGDEAFLDQLYAEGIAEDDYEPYDPGDD